MNHQGGTRGASNLNENIDQNQVGAARTDTSSSGEISAHRRRRIRLSNLDSTGGEHVGNNGGATINLDLNLSPTPENNSGSTSSTLNDGVRGNMADDQEEIGGRITANGTISLPLKRSSTDREFLEGGSSSSGAQAGPSSKRASSSALSSEHVGASSSQQHGPTQHVVRNPVPVNMIDYSHIERENVEPLHGLGNIQGNTMLVDETINLFESLSNHIELNGSFAGNVTNALSQLPEIGRHELEHYLTDMPVRTVSNSITENEHNSVATSEIRANDNAEQQPLHGPLLSIRDPQVRAVVEAQVQIARERLRSGQILRFQDYMALDYEVLSRALEQQRQRIQQIEGNEPGLTEEEILKHIRCENFEVVGQMTPEDKEVCAICQGDFANGEEIGRLDCAHRFHIHCIKQWLVEKNLCPLCKRRGLLVVHEVDE